LLGLGYPREYKSICEKGLMRFVSIGQPIPRISSWYTMTEEGEKILKALKNAGLKFPKHYNNFNLTDNGQQIFDKVINQMFK
jgi:predicted transcriptional regulator